MCLKLTWYILDCDTADSALNERYIKQKYQQGTLAYNSTAVYTCINGSILYRNNTMASGVSEYEVSCNEAAKWESTHGFECWYGKNIVSFYVGWPSLNIK